MISAVIDTNILISALMKADTTPRQVLRYCLQGDVLPLIGNALYLEYEEVINRKSLFNRSPVSQQESSNSRYPPELESHALVAALIF